MAWFRCTDVLNGSVLGYEIKGGYFEVKDPKHISILLREPERFVRVTEEQIKKMSAPPAFVPAPVEEKAEVKEEQKTEEVESEIPVDLPASSLLGGNSVLKKVETPKEEVKEEPEEKVEITSEDVGSVEDVLGISEPEEVKEENKPVKKVKKTSGKKKKKKAVKKSGKKVKKKAVDEEPQEEDD